MSANHHRDHEAKYFYRPPQRNCWQTFHEFLWNPRDHTACSRTPLNWLTITVYYIIFLACVFGILYGSLEVVKWVAVTNNPNKPRFGMDETPIGSIPSVNFLPLNTETGPLLWLDDVDPYIKKIDDFLADYRNCKGPKCFDVSNLAECGVSPYGYKDGQPCIYLKLNRLIEWTPEPYTANDTLPGDMPKDLKETIKNSTASKVWVFCKGTTAIDRDHIPSDKINYQNHGFDPSFFPFFRQKKYLDPLVAMKINATDLKKFIHSLTCSAWAKNLDGSKSSAAILYRTGERNMSGSCSARKKPRLLTDTEKRLIKEAFDLFDSNNDGYIDYYEFKASTRCLGFELKKTELLNILHTYDRDNKNLINYEDFYEIMEEKIQKRDRTEEVREAFKLIANDKTNCISFRDLKYAADRVGADISDRDLRSMIEEFDTKGEGKLDEEDFINVITGDAV